MLVYKINVIEELEKVGMNTTKARNTGVFGQETMKKFRNGDTKISLDKSQSALCSFGNAAKRYYKIRGNRR